MINLNNKKIVLIAVYSLLSLLAMDVNSSQMDYGDDESHESQKKPSANFGLSQKAIKLMQIKTLKIRSLVQNKFVIPKSALVNYGEDHGVFKYDGEHFKLITIAHLKQGKSSITIESEMLHDGDLVVTKGVPLLRVAHLQASGQGGEGHGH